jgi:hypothetical protein
MNSETELKARARFQGWLARPRPEKNLGAGPIFADVVSLLAGNHFHHIVIAVDGTMGVLSTATSTANGRVSD